MLFVHSYVLAHVSQARQAKKFPKDYTWKFHKLVGAFYSEYIMLQPYATTDSNYNETKKWLPGYGVHTDRFMCNPFVIYEKRGFRSPSLEVQPSYTVGENRCKSYGECNEN